MKNIKFKDETRSFGPPEGWIEELDGPCLTISIHDYVDEVTGMPMMMTAWELNDGHTLYLCISGTVHPVIKIFEGEPDNAHERSAADPSDA